MVTVPHITNRTSDWLRHYRLGGGGGADRNPYSPDLVPSDSHLLGPGTCITYLYIYTHRYVMQLNMLYGGSNNLLNIKADSTHTVLD
jgi:hypothetical protein